MRAIAAVRVVVAAVVASLVAIAVPAGAAEPAPASAPAHTWELLLLPGDWPAARPPQDDATAWPLLKQRARKPALVLRPADVESYVWSVQRITLTPSATKRMLAVHPDTDMEQWYIPKYPFAVRVDGDFLYGGVFDGPMSQMTMDMPVIHGEIVDGRAVLHLLPRQESFVFDPRFEETVGAQDGSLLADFFAETEPFGAAADEEDADPVRDRFRPVLRDPRIHDVFAPLGTLVEAPPPPPDEAVLSAADRAVDAARAAAQHERIARQLADDYHLFYPLGYRLGFRQHAPMSKKGTQELFGEDWKPGRYAVLATQAKVEGDSGVVYTLFYFRGRADGQDEAKAILARRRYRRMGTGWQLVLEIHHKCFDDGRAERAWDGVAGMMVMVEGPCWPPPDDEQEPPVPPPGEMVE
jgi:ketosteroid isomerase-like protein